MLFELQLKFSDTVDVLWYTIDALWITIEKGKIISFFESVCAKIDNFELS